MSLPPLHLRRTTTRFSDRVEDYARSRPTYPSEAIDAILDGLGDPPSLTCADIGAGTGIMTRPLAERGVRVHAIEPNAAMRAAGEQYLADGWDRLPAGTAQGCDQLPAGTAQGCDQLPAGPAQGCDQLPAGPAQGCDRLPAGRAQGWDRLPAGRKQAPGQVTWHSTTAEATALPDASLDLVVCAQSYHWFEPTRACAEFARILKRPGRLALIWNDGDESTPVAKRYYELVRAASTEGTTAHQDAAHAPTVAPPFADLREQHFRHIHELDLDSLIRRAMSASYVPKEGLSAERLVEGLRKLHREHASSQGGVEFVYEVWLWLASV